MFLIPCSLSDLDNNYAGWCTDVCCDWKTEEICYNDAIGTNYCAEIAGGGCPCPEGTAKCGQGKIILLHCVANENCRLYSFLLYLSFLLLIIRS